MLKKLALAATIVAGSFVATENTADAGDCYYGRGIASHHAYRHARVYRAPRPVGVYRPPFYGRPPGAYRSFYPYAYGGRGRYIGPGVGFGYGSFGTFGPYRRGGVSIGIGF